MSPLSRKTESSQEAVSLEDQDSQKLFDNYGPVNVRETIGTFFLGVLAIMLLIALQRSWKDYEGLLRQKSGYE